MLVLQEAKSETELAEIDMFLQEITGACSSQGTFRYLAPGLLNNATEDNMCQNVSLSSPEFRNSLTSLSANDTWITSTDVEQPFLRMFETVLTCEKNRNVSRGGVLYFFTNLKCSSNCVEMTYLFDLIQHQKELVDKLNSIGYLLKVIYMDNGNDSTINCDIKSALDYCTKFEDVLISGDSIAGLNEYIDRLTPCLVPVKKPKKGLRTKDLLLIILVPVFCTVFGVSLCLIVYIYRGRSRVSLLKQFKHKENARIGQIKKIDENMAVVSERYNALKILAETQRKSSLEVDPSDLFIEYVSIDSKEKGKYSHGILKGSTDRQLPIKPNAAGHFEVAVKRLSPASSDFAKIKLFKECEIMKELGPHPHVLHLIGTVSSTVDPMLITEFCVYKDLLSLLRKSSNNLTPLNDDSETILRDSELLSIAWQISVGMEHVHACGILHRALCASNIFITHGHLAKIGNFSSACSVGNTAAAVDDFLWKHGAIESIENNEFSTQTDVWSFGITLFELFSFGVQPFDHFESPAILVNELKRGLGPPIETIRAEREIKNLIIDCSLQNPQHRPCFSEITKRLARCLRASDDDYGYVQISRRRSTLQSIISSALSVK